MLCHNNVLLLLRMFVLVLVSFIVFAIVPAAVFSEIGGIVGF